MSEISKKNLTEIVALIKKKEIKSEELTQSFIKNINNDKKLNTFITKCTEEALKKAKNFDKTQDHNIFDCIECGCCSYGFPSNIPLVQFYRFAKTEIYSLEEEKKNSDIARQRHEFRQFREERKKARAASKKKSTKGKVKKTTKKAPAKKTKKSKKK